VPIQTDTHTVRLTDANRFLAMSSPIRLSVTFVHLMLRQVMCSTVMPMNLWVNDVRWCAVFRQTGILGIRDKKLIRRWGSERELSLPRHRTFVQQNTIDSCINSATDRRGGYVLERMFTKFSEITHCNGHYAVQGHSRSQILVPIESSYRTAYYWLIVTYLLSCTVSKLWSNFRWREGSALL